MHTMRRTVLWWVVIASIAAVGAALLFGRGTASGAAAVLYVAPAGADRATCGAESAPCKTISQAVTNAATGDTIVVAAGTYAEQVTIAKPLTLTGKQATIDATGHDNGILLMTNAAGSASGSTVSGFTVERAIGEGVLAMQVSNVTIANNAVVDNDTGAGTSQTKECAPQGPVPGDCGEGLHLMTVANSTVSGNTVEGNDGGILVTDELGPTHGNQIVHNTVTGNVKDCGITLASHSPKAVANGQPQPALGGVYDNTVSGNLSAKNGTAGAGVGIFAAAPGAGAYGNVVKGNIIFGNGMPGVTIHSHAPNQDVNGNQIVDNQIGTNGTGGDPDFGNADTTGIAIGSAVIPVTGTVISGNTIGDVTDGVWATTNVSTSGISANTLTNVTTALKQVAPKPPAAPPGAAPAPATTGMAGLVSGSAGIGGIAGEVALLLVLAATAVAATRSRLDGRP